MVPRSCSWRRGSRPSRQASGDVCALLSAVSSPRNTAGHAVVKSWKWLDPFANFFGAIVGGGVVCSSGSEVNRQAWAAPPAKWERLDVYESSLEDRKPVVGKTKSGFAVFVVKLDDKIYAMGNTCTHAGGPLNEGTWVGADRCEIQCPWHASRFCVKDAKVHGGPATFSEVRFQTRAADGRVEVRAI